MKIKINIGIIIIAFSVLLYKCTTIEGPMGPAGTDGTNGVDGEFICLSCHSLSVKAAVDSQFMQSIHYTSQIQYNGEPTYIYAGEGKYRKDCARCHTHEGFSEILETGSDTLIAGLENPSHITCETCHDSHKTFDFETDGQDYALRSTSPIILYSDGSTVVNINTASNACIYCHQPRKAWDYYDNGSSSHPDSVYISNSHDGPHHSPQAAVIMGVSGITSGTPMKHKDLGCTGCHMGEIGNDAGGHSFTPQVGNCTPCHASASNFDINNYQTNLTVKIDQLITKLHSKGILDTDGNTVPGVYPRKTFQAWWNYIVIKEDRSLGVHNPDYCETLVDNAIALLP